MDYKIPYTKEDLAKIRALVSSNKEQIAAIYSEYQEVAKNLESPEERIQKLKNERKGQIEVRNSGNGIFHLIPYSMKYDNSDPNKKQPGAKMHLFFGKKEGDQFKIVIRGSNTFGDKNNACDPIIPPHSKDIHSPGITTADMRAMYTLYMNPKNIKNYPLFKRISKKKKKKKS
ncbi:MAG: hypothetical protein J6Z11_00815, partial [Candidatus Riflebacteria bacterium]|nr:hypothetical protein [Candidatus Riflebacteria bacterium]